MSKASINRRDLIHFAGLSAVGIPMAFKTALAATALVPVGKSVFDSNECHDGSKNKYKNPDKNVVYPLIAFWLMLTTEDWDECMKNATWRKDLASELGMSPQHLENLYATAHSTDTKEHPDFTNMQAFDRVRQTWQKFIKHPEQLPAPSNSPSSSPSPSGTSPSSVSETAAPVDAFYGARPCPGGNTLRQIARGCKK